MADFDFEEEDPYFDEEDDFEFDPRDDWGYNWHDNYGVINRNRPDVQLKSEYAVYSFGSDKIDAFYRSQEKKRFWDAERSSRDRLTHPIKFYLDPKTDQLFAKVEKSIWERRC